jgi:hypothetical protein
VIERGSPLWNRLLTPIEGRCRECDFYTERRDIDTDSWLCESCNAALARGQERDKYMDDPRHEPYGNLK